MSLGWVDMGDTGHGETWTRQSQHAKGEKLVKAVKIKTREKFGRILQRDNFLNPQDSESNLLWQWLKVLV